MSECLVPYEYCTYSRVIHRTKCLLYGFIVTPDGSNNSYADIFDGDNATEPQAMRVRVVSTTSAVVLFREPIVLQRGLYVSFGANLSSVTILSLPLKE